MAIKPVIIYIGHNGAYDDVDCLRDALGHFFNQHLGCEVWLFRDFISLKEHELPVKKLANAGRIVAFLVAQERYVDEHLQVAEFIRQDVSKAVYIGIIRNFVTDGEIKTDLGDVNLRVLRHENEAVDKVADIVKVWKGPVGNTDFFGLQTRDEVRFCCSMFETVYRTHDSECHEPELYATNREEKTLFEALRMRLLPATELKSEFDDVVKISIPQRTEIERSEPDVYQTEVNKILAFNADERKDFRRKLLSARGYQELEHGVRKVETGQGEKNFGFAIDAITFESQVTRGFGSHQLAEFYLKERLDYLNMLKIHRHLIEKEENGDSEILSGVVVNDLEGFKTPILVLFSRMYPVGVVNKAAAYIRSCRQFIPVTPDGQLLGV